MYCLSVLRTALDYRSRAMDWVGAAEFVMQCCGLKAFGVKGRSCMYPQVSPPSYLSRHSQAGCSVALNQPSRNINQQS